MAHQPPHQQPPVPKPRTKFQAAKPRPDPQSSLKRQLVEAFDGFNSNTLGGRQLELAKACVEARVYDCYQLLSFKTIVEQNRDKPNYLSTMTAAFDSLLKYINNLLKPKRPPVWRTIKTNIPWFENRVASINGGRQVLKIAGYSVETEDALEFPSYVEEPDKPLLYMLTAELHMAKLELEMMSSSRRPNQYTNVDPRHRSASTDLHHVRGSDHRNNGRGLSMQEQSGDGRGAYGTSHSGGAPMRAGGGNITQPVSSHYQPMRAGGPDSTQPIRAGSGVNNTQPVSASGGFNGGYPSGTGGFSGVQTTGAGGFVSSHPSSHYSHGAGAGLSAGNLNSPSTSGRGVSFATESNSAQGRFPDSRYPGGPPVTSSGSQDQHAPPVPRRRTRTSSSGSSGSASTPTSTTERTFQPRQDPLSPVSQGSYSSSQSSYSSTAHGSYSSSSQSSCPAISQGLPTSQGSYPTSTAGSYSSNVQPVSQGSYSPVSQPPVSQGLYPPVSQGGYSSGFNPPASQNTYLPNSDTLNATAISQRLYPTPHGSLSPNSSGSYSSNPQESFSSKAPGSMSSQKSSSSQRSYVSAFDGSCQAVPQSYSPTPQRAVAPDMQASQDAVGSGLKQHPSLNSAGSSRESSISSVSTVASQSTVTMSESSSTKTLQDTGKELSASEKLRKQLDLFRKRREEATSNVRTEAAARLGAPSPADSDIRRHNTVNIGSIIAEEPREPTISLSSSTPSFPTSISPSSTDIKLPPGKTQPTFSGDITRFSGDRGEVLTGRRICINVTCALEVLPGQMFCGYCGTKQTGSAPSADPQPAPRADTGHSGEMSSIDLPTAAAGGTIGFSPILGRKGTQSDGQSTQSGLDQLREKEEAYKRHLEKEAAAAVSRREAYLNNASPPSTHKSSPPSTHKSSPPISHSKSGLDYLIKKEEAWKQAQRKKGVKEEDLEPLQERVDEERRIKEEQKAWQRDQVSSHPSHPQASAYPPHPQASAYPPHSQASAHPPPPHPQASADPPRPQASSQLPRSQPQLEKQQKETKPDSRKEQKPKPNLKNFERQNLMQNNYAKQNEEEKLISALAKDGEDLLRAIKDCTLYDYSIGEVQIAFLACKKTGDPILRYLDRDWANMTGVVCEYVQRWRNNHGNSVGKPTEKEARMALEEFKGDINKAVQKICSQREEKVLSLLKKVEHMREVEPSLPELDWGSAVTALTRNEMDVDATCYAIQTERLQPLYEYIFSEYSEVAKTDMEEIKKIIKNKQQYQLEARLRLLMAEYRYKEKFRAEIVLGLLNEVEYDGGPDYPLNYYVEAARDFNDLESARNFLNKECPICGEMTPIHEMVTMPGCTDSFCKLCFKGNFEVVIKEQGVKHFHCPLCQLPDMGDKEATEGLYIDIFVAMAKEHLDREVYVLMMEKLKDFNLTKEDGFIWCPSTECRSGFIFDAEVARIPRDISCPNCKRRMCLMCKKPWEAQHEGITCEQFAKWKQDNDPDAQKQGLAAHLNANGIECPQCHMRYDLARGGCMHFRCTRCPNEFCSGCSQSFKNGKQCGKLKSCEKKGLHAHHPRDCLFYLRDFDVKELQDFLRENQMEFDVEPPREQVKAARRKLRLQKKGEAAGEEVEEEEEEGEEEEIDNKGEEVKLECSVMLQKEVPEGLKDEECGRPVENGHAGLCGVHYKEYLVDKINKNKLDPIGIYSTAKIKIMLTREERQVPPMHENDDDDDDVETEEEYRERLITHVKKELPLNEGEEPAQEAPPPAAQGIAVEDLEAPAQ